MTQTTNAHIFSLMEKWAPKAFAYDWDNIGLQIGSYNKPVRKIMVTLDVLESVVEEAIENEVDLIIAHHPLLFKPLKEINVDSWRGRIIKKLIQHDITVYAAHTNLDVAKGGVNDLLADLIGLEDKVVLVETNEDSLCKVVVYIPETHVEVVTDALAKAGAGHIGHYSHCTFQTKGTGTFMPLGEANPFIGKKNQLEMVPEVKVETIVQQSILSNVLKGMIAAHPYEEVAYDVIPLKNEGEKIGLGRVGNLKEVTTLDEFVTKVKNVLEVNYVRVSGDSNRKVKRVAVLGGSGEKYFHSAIQKKADVYITGDMTFHVAQEAIEMGISVIDAGHYIEKVMKSATKQYLEQQIKEDATLNKSLEIIVSETNTDPFQYR
ncbi:Nif3-like dinuclear metal center hexameric protein [Ornithinibacillus massiliensis]|uniref:GTP cyclohydrolase 1 type 2 homolog n=1 Tax=Ornithinibacillus massiliensis TaxID=1944633 RepID=A0ABS5MB92_9BACI|nr:Nif3-like dinuclear metal center hexameric protein [Ornithinibacillus massiliensis]MBS3679560.1 Nif3-like dinuclear metal center hexameric protein [Ornithinibacillus massiliensis]